MRARTYRLASHGGLHRMSTRRQTMGHPWKVAFITIGVIIYAGLSVVASVTGAALADHPEALEVIAWLSR